MIDTISWEFNVRTDTQIIVSISIWNTRHKKLSHKRKPNTTCEKSNNLMTIFKRIFGCSWHFYRLNVRKTNRQPHIWLICWRCGAFDFFIIIVFFFVSKLATIITLWLRVFLIWSSVNARGSLHTWIASRWFDTPLSLYRSFPFIRFYSPTPSFVEWRRDNERK